MTAHGQCLGFQLESARISEIEREGVVPLKHDDHIAPFRTLSAMVNAECNLKCAHCDLPRRFDRYGGALGPSEWEDLLDKLLPDVRPEVISVAAMEPLLPKTGQPRTAAILRCAARYGIPAGIVTNGIHAEGFFAAHGHDIFMDFFDLSVDGPSEIDTHIRNSRHFACADKLLSGRILDNFAKRIYVSCTLTTLSAKTEVLGPFFDWVKRRIREPRLVLLLLYPNVHVRPDLILDDEDVLRVLDLIVHKSREFADLFLDIFPSSLPGFSNLVERGILPGEGEVLRDSTGVLWGHVAENLFVRYQNKKDLNRYNLRISPEGFALPAGNFERRDYLNGAFGQLPREQWTTVQERILTTVTKEYDSVPAYCRNMPCVSLCRGENSRCEQKGLPLQTEKVLSCQNIALVRAPFD